MKETTEELINKVMIFNLNTDTIIPTKYSELVSDLSRRLPGMQNELLSLPKEERNTYWEQLYWINSGQFNYLKGSMRDAKKIQSYLSKNSVLYPIVSKFIEDSDIFLSVYEKLKLIKANCVKKKESKTVEKERNFEQIKGALNKDIKEKLSYIAERFRKDIEISYVKYYNNLINIYIERSKKFGSKDPTRLFKDREAIWDIRIFLTPKLEIIPNTVEKINIVSKQRSEDVIESFIKKMYFKLGGLLSDINQPVTTSDLGNYKRNEIDFKFDDGSYFTVRNSIVVSHSKYGKPFYRYPTTFHNMKLSNGKFLPNPSELDLKKSFNQFYSK